jgi:hypothetical protein
MMYYGDFWNEKKCAYEVKLTKKALGETFCSCCGAHLQSKARLRPNKYGYGITVVETDALEPMDTPEMRIDVVQTRSGPVTVLLHPSDVKRLGT